MTLTLPELQSTRAIYKTEKCIPQGREEDLSESEDNRSMMNLYSMPWKALSSAIRLQGRYSENTFKFFQAAAEQVKTSQLCMSGVMAYIDDFMTPYWTALDSFLSLEREKLLRTHPGKTCCDYSELLHFNADIAKKGWKSSFSAWHEYQAGEAGKTFRAWLNTVFLREGADIREHSKRRSGLMEAIVYRYPEAIRRIEPDFGFHFDDGGYVKAGETDRFDLWQVLPTDRKVKVRAKGKPVLVIPPYVLGAGILAFLPKENKSFTHSFANQGIPTYIRIMKKIEDTPAVQVMTGEDDCLDTRRFCEILREKHGRQVTLNGFCQGGYVSVCNLLSGELDGLVDAFITCVAPMDGIRSKSLIEYLAHLPPRFRDLGYAIKTLPNGNRVVDGKVMSWVYKLKSMEREAPVSAFYRTLMVFDQEENVRITSTAAALNYWLIYERSDLPIGITQMSFDSYTVPVTAGGTLPVRLFGRELNFKRLKEKGIKWLLCYAAEDDLVDKDAALSPIDFVDAEVTEFPKGHGAIATSWSLPTSACALHTRFGEKKFRGPVRFALDIEQEQED